MLRTLPALGLERLIRVTSLVTISDGYRSPRMRTTMTLALLSILLIAAVPTAASAGKGSPVQGKPQTCPKGKTGWDAKGLVGKRLPKAKRIAARHLSLIHI